MTKEQSLDFLQHTLDKLEKATDEEIKTYEEMYNENCLKTKEAQSND